MYRNRVNKKNTEFENLLVIIVDGLIAGGYTQGEAVELVSDLFETVMEPDELIERVTRMRVSGFCA